MLSMHFAASNGCIFKSCSLHLLRNAREVLPDLALQRLQIVPILIMRLSSWCFFDRRYFAKEMESLGRDSWQPCSGFY